MTVEPTRIMTGKHRQARGWVVLMVMVLVASFFAAVAAVPALARWGSPTSFGSGQLNNPVGVAVDQSNGDVYVGNLLEGQNDRFDSSHTLVTPPSPFGAGSGLYSGVAVDPTTGHVFIVDAGSEALDTYDASSGTLVSSFSVLGSGNFFGALTVVQIAADAAGNIYLPNSPNNEIQVFGSSGGTPIGVPPIITGSGANALSAPLGVAVDHDGNIWVADNGNNRIEEFDSSGAFVTQIASIGVKAVAVDAIGDVFASIQDGSGTHVLEYNPAGVQIEDFGLGTLGISTFETLNSIAIDETRDVIYVADGGKNVVWAFVPSPEVVTGHASNVQLTSATVAGHVDPAGAGDIASCQFEYGTSTSYGQTAPCSPATPYSSVMDVTAGLTGLTPGTTYHFRLDATNTHGTESGSDETFITPGPPSIESESSSDAVTRTATLKARIDPLGYETTCHAQYVDEAEFQSSGYTNAVTIPCTPEDLGAVFVGQDIATDLSGLSIDTVYHFRFIATNQAGTTTGTDQTLATFGIKTFSFGAFDQSDQPYTQAGGHPFDLTANFVFNTTTNQFGNYEIADANPRTVRVELPPGLIGNPEATSKCSPYNVAHAGCSGDTQVGILKIYTTRAVTGTESPIYNVVPPYGVAAQFGARFNGFVTAHIDAKIRTGGDYGVTSDSLYISAGEGILGVSVTLWGVPADKIHDAERYCPPAPGSGKINEEGPCTSGVPLTPFLTNSTFCSGPQTTTAKMDSWQEPGVFVQATSQMPAFTRCDKLSFNPSIKIQPVSKIADSPTGMEVNLHIPQNKSPVGLAEPNLKDAVVTLPQGISVDPSSANGLEACSPAQIELNGPEPANCPDASKVGSVEVGTPLLDHPLKGAVYVATQEENPFHSLFAIYIAVNDPQSGAVLKLAGKVTPDPETGRLTTSFTENPQLPFEDLKLVFFGGSKAALATPQTCGTFEATSELTPWSAPESGPPVKSSIPFAIGSGCTSGFTPAFSAGTVSNQAGGFSPFTLTLSRKDGERNLSGLSVTMPPGLAAILAKVPLCPETLAQAGTCSADSRIGTTNTAAGAGPEPYWLSGPVYLTGPYNGAPFGLSVVVPAVAGPFNLGTVVVRAAINVDPKTAQVTVTSDPLPQIRDGVPFRLKTVNVTIDRPGFIFNPTSCSQLHVTGAVSGAMLDGSQATTAAVSTPFATAGCKGLPFKPVFKVSTSAHHSRKNGASLHVVVQSGAGQANIGSVVVELPKILPSRLATLSLACTAKVFDVNPASCPAGSKVGTASAHTPVLPVPLSGPVYFVSHGGAKFPELVVVLQGDGVTVELAGETFISRKSVTRSTFGSVPDVPVTRFDLTLPSGPHSALTATGDLCKHALIMPTTIKGQNGAVIKQSTKVAVSGCPKAKKKAKAGKSKKAGKGKK